MKNTVQDSENNRISTDPIDDQENFIIPKDSAVRLLQSRSPYEDNKHHPTSTLESHPDQDDTINDKSANEQNKNGRDPLKLLEITPRFHNQAFSNPNDKSKSFHKSQNSSEIQNENEVVKLEVSLEQGIRSLNQSKSQAPSGNITVRSNNKENLQNSREKDSTVNSIKRKVQSFQHLTTPSTKYPSPSLIDLRARDSPDAKVTKAPSRNFLKRTSTRIKSIFKKRDPEKEDEHYKVRPFISILQKAAEPLHKRILGSQLDQEEEDDLEDRHELMLGTLGVDVIRRGTMTTVNSSDESELSEDEIQAIRKLSKKKRRFGTLHDDDEVEAVPNALVTLVKDKVTGENLIPSKNIAQKDTKLRIMLEKHSTKKHKSKEIKSIVRDLRKTEGKCSKACVKLKHKCSSVFDLFVLYYLKLKKPFDPKKPFKMIWDITIGLIIFWNISYIPFDIAFGTGHDYGVRSLEILMTTMFFMDILISFHTGYYREIHFVQSHKKIFRKYFFGWFFIDLISSLPIGTLFLTDDDYEGTPLLRLLNVIKVARVFKLARIFKIKKTLDDFKDTLNFSQLTEGIIKFLSLFVSVLFIAHCVACMWFYVSKVAIINGQDGWITSKLDPNDDVSTQYLTSIYWTVTTMMTVGYGDITPVNQSERCVAMFVMLFGCGVFGYCINKVAEILGEINREYSYQSTKLFFLNRFLRTNQIDDLTQSKARDYLKFVFEVQAESQSEEMEVVKMLSSNLQESLTVAVNAQALRRCNIIKNNFSTRFVSTLSTHLESRIYSPDEIIFNEGEHDNEGLYIIKTGQIKTFIKKFNLHLKNLGHDHVFGELNFITQQTRLYSAKSIRFSSIFVLKLSDFLRLANEHQSEKEMFHMIKDRIILNRENVLLASKCQLCQRLTHNVFSCPLLFPQKDISSIISAYLDDLITFRSNFARKGQRKPNALANFKRQEDNVLRFRRALMENSSPPKSAIMDQDKTIEDSRLGGRNSTRKTQQEKIKRMRTTADVTPGQLDPLSPLLKLNPRTNNYDDEMISKKDYDDLLASPDNQRKARADNFLETLEKNEEESKEEKIKIEDIVDLEEKRDENPLEIIEESNDEYLERTPKHINESPLRSLRITSLERAKTPEKEKVFTPHFLLRPPPKFIEDDFVFESVKNYEIYFPQNNATKVADEINSVIENRRKVYVGLYTTNDVNIFKLKLGRIINKLKKNNPIIEKSKNEVANAFSAGFNSNSVSANYPQDD